MSVRQQQLENGIWLVSVSGRIDQTLSPELDQHLIDLTDAGHSRLVVDLSEATYINSGGLRCLVSAWRKSKNAGGSLILCGLNSRLQEIFEMIGFDRVFQIFDGREQALAAQNSLDRD